MASLCAPLKRLRLPGPRAWFPQPESLSRSFIATAASAACLAITLDPGTALAQTPAPPQAGSRNGIVELTWNDVVRRSAADPRRTLELARLAHAEAQVGAVRAAPNPTLDLAIARGYAQAGDESRTEWEAELEMPLSWLARRGPRVDAARHTVNAAGHDAQLAWRQALFELSDLFWQTAQQQKLVEELEALASETSSIAEAVTRRVDSGEARPIERLKIEVERETIQGETDAARAALQSRRRQLAAWLGLDAMPVVVASFDTPPAVAPFEAARASARAHHPSIHAAQARVRAASAEVTAEQRNRIPEVAVRGFAQSELDRRAYGAGITIDLPLWNWNSPGVNAARAQVSVARRELELVSRALESAIADKQGACEAAASLAKVYRDRLVPAAVRSAAIATTSYRAGEIGLLDVIDSRRVLIATRKNAIEALAKAHAECQQLTILTAAEVPSP